MRFKKYKLIIYSKIIGMRIIKREMADKEYNRVRGSVLDRNIYIVQKHRKFLGITYWKTLVKTTSYKIANDAYDWMTYDDKIGF